jgi:hypothetical protein
VSEPFDARPAGEASIVERLSRLKGVSWEWRDPEKWGHGRYVGVIAQDVQEVFPDLVREAPDGTLRVDYNGFVAPLIEAVKELDARLQAIEARLDST